MSGREDVLVSERESDVLVSDRDSGCVLLVTGRTLLPIAVGR